MLLAHVSSRSVGTLVCIVSMPLKCLVSAVRYSVHIFSDVIYCGCRCFRRYFWTTTQLYRLVAVAFIMNEPNDDAVI